MFVAVSSYTASVARQLGPTRPVLTLARNVPAYQQLTPADLIERNVPQMYTSNTELASFGQIGGRVPAVGLRQGAPLQDGALVDVPVARRNEREMTVDVGIQDSIAAALGPDDRVDIVAAYRSKGEKPAYAAVVVAGARVLRVTPIPRPAGASNSDTRLAVTFALSTKQVQAVALAQAVADSLRLVLQPRGAKGFTNMSAAKRSS
jgi:Flp pilus assembly protein CpaB